MHLHGLPRLTYLSRLSRAAFSVWRYTPGSQLSCCSALQTRELQQALHEAEAQAKTLESSQAQLRTQVDSLNQRLQQAEQARALEKKQAAEACLARERERDAAKDLADKYKKGMEEEAAHAEEQQGLVQSLKDKMEVRLCVEALVAVNHGFLCIDHLQPMMRWGMHPAGWRCVCLVYIVCSVQAHTI